MERVLRNLPSQVLKHMQRHQLEVVHLLSASSYTKATVNVQGGRASAKVESNSLGHGSASSQSSSQKKKGSLLHSKNKMR